MCVWMTLILRCCQDPRLPRRLWLVAIREDAGVCLDAIGLFQKEKKFLSRRLFLINGFCDPFGTKSVPRQASDLWRATSPQDRPAPQLNFLLKPLTPPPNFRFHFSFPPNASTKPAARHPLSTLGHQQLLHFIDFITSNHLIMTGRKLSSSPPPFTRPSLLSLS